MYDTPSLVIEALGGATFVAAELQRPVSTVASWGPRRSIPVDCWPALVEIAGRKNLPGLTYEALVFAHIEPSHRSGIANTAGGASGGDAPATIAAE